MGAFSIWHWVIVLVVVLVLFGGGGKISKLMGDFGKGLKSFKKNIKEEEVGLGRRFRISDRCTNRGGDPRVLLRRGVLRLPPAQGRARGRGERHGDGRSDGDRIGARGDGQGRRGAAAAGRWYAEPGPGGGRDDLKHTPPSLPIVSPKS